MRHKYQTRGIVLARAPLGEANALITLLTPGLGLLRARAQGLRQPRAKLAAALTTFSESDLILVRGKEGWRIAGAVLAENWFKRMQDSAPRARATRVCGLLLRLVAGESRDPALFSLTSGFFAALSTLPEADHEAAEVLAALSILAALGLDAGEIPGGESAFSRDALAQIIQERSRYVTRINLGIAASGL